MPPLPILNLADTATPTALSAGTSTPITNLQTAIITFIHSVPQSLTRGDSAFMRSLTIALVSLASVPAFCAEYVYLIVGTSPNPALIQSLTAVAYGSRAECENGLRLMAIKDTTPTKVKVTVAPYCTETKPVFWPD